MKFLDLITATALFFPLLQGLGFVIALPLNDDPSVQQQQRHHEAKVKRQCLPNGSFYDDASVKVPLEYIGAWTHLSNQGNTVKSGTLSYTGQANAYVSRLFTPEPIQGS